MSTVILGWMKEKFHHYHWTGTGIHIISQGVADPVFDYDIIPLTYTDSRWMAYVIRADINAMKAVVPEPIEVQDDVIEFLVRNTQEHDVRSIHGDGRNVLGNSG